MDKNGGTITIFGKQKPFSIRIPERERPGYLTNYQLRKCSVGRSKLKAVIQV